MLEVNEALSEQRKSNVRRKLQSVVKYGGNKKNRSIAHQCALITHFRLIALAMKLLRTGDVAGANSSAELHVTNANNNKHKRQLLFN